MNGHRRLLFASFIVGLGVVSALAGCGGGGINPGDTPDANLYPTIDGGVLPDSNRPDANLNDAFIPGNCTPGTTQCSDCADNDGDGFFDGFDPECTGTLDDREDSFATGIPGDNMDEKKQDCFFDGNSGAGNDHCDIFTCCILGNCPAGTDCTLDPRCIEFCKPAVPPGCDCFGCCTICKEGVCYDVYINPAVAPNCDYDNVESPITCPRCVKQESCSNECNETCILCPGQDPSTLHCDGGPQCTAPATPCQTSAECATGLACFQGCCIDVIE